VLSPKKADRDHDDDDDDGGDCGGKSGHPITVCCFGFCEVVLGCWLPGGPAR
jgi:hypothetical protein